MKAYINDEDIMNEDKWQEYLRQCEIEDKKADLRFEIAGTVCIVVWIVNLILHVYLFYLTK